MASKGKSRPLCLIGLVSSSIRKCVDNILNSYQGFISLPFCNCGLGYFVFPIFFVQRLEFAFCQMVQFYICFMSLLQHEIGFHPETSLACNCLGIKLDFASIRRALPPTTWPNGCCERALAHTCARLAELQPRLRRLPSRALSNGGRPCASQ